MAEREGKGNTLANSGKRRYLERKKGGKCVNTHRPVGQSPSDFQFITKFQARVRMAVPTGANSFFSRESDG